MKYFTLKSAVISLSIAAIFLAIGWNSSATILAVIAIVKILVCVVREVE